MPRVSQQTLVHDFLGLAEVALLTASARQTPVVNRGRTVLAFQHLLPKGLGALPILSFRRLLRFGQLERLWTPRSRRLQSRQALLPSAELRAEKAGFWLRRRLD